jgi:hypothetical protein
MHTQSINDENNLTETFKSSTLSHIPITRPALQSISTNTPLNLDPVDQEDGSDPQRLGYYAQEIYDYLQKRECLNGPSTEYMNIQPDLNYKMRAILVDWLVSVHLKFKLVPETLFLSVNILDRYLSLRSIKRQDLQLVGISAMLIASKYEEIYPPELKDFVYLTDKAYDKDQVRRMECEILSVLEFQVTIPSTWRFLERYARISELDEISLCLAKYMIELPLLEYAMLKYAPSLIAASAVFLAMKIFRKEPAWNPRLLFHTKYNESQLRPCAKDLLVLFQSAPKHTLSAIRDKYGRKEFNEVSKIRIS